MTFRGKVLGAALLLSLCAGGAQVRAGANPDALAALKRGQVALDRADPRTARVELMNAIKADPALAAARVAQARALLMLGNAIAAQDELDMAQKLGAPMRSMRHLRAHAALLTGKAQAAIAEARAPDLDPAETLFATRIEGQAWQALARFDEAGKAFERARALAPDNAALWADLGRFHLASGNMAAAHAAADRALALAPNSAETLVLRAMLVREQYGLVAAMPLFARAVEVAPTDVPALIEYAATLADAGQARYALSLTRRALSLAPGLPRAYFIQAVMAARAGQYDLARNLLARTRGLMDGQAATRMLRGALHLQSGNATLAIAQFEPLLAGQPLNLRARLLLADAYYRDGQYPEAEATLFPIVERADADSYALDLAARIHEAMGDRAVAGAFLTRASAPVRGASDVFKGAGSPAETAPAALAAPADAYANLRYIRALLEAKQAGAALARAQALRAANPGAPAAHIAEGDCLTFAGRHRDAAAAYEKAANIRFSEDVALRLIDAWSRAGRADKARDVLLLYLAQNPMSVEMNRLAAAYLLAAKEYDRALVLLEGLRARLGNEDAQLMTDIARAHIGKGEAGKALPFAAHAWRLAPASAVSADIFGWALFKARGSNAAARELLAKAAQIAPDEPLVRDHLRAAGG